MNELAITFKTSKTIILSRQTSVLLATPMVYTTQMNVDMMDDARQPSMVAMNAGKIVFGVTSAPRLRRIQPTTIPREVANVMSDAVAKGHTCVSVDLKLSASIHTKISKTSAATQIPTCTSKSIVLAKFGILVSLKSKAETKYGK